jgi:hypothetical protein
MIVSETFYTALEEFILLWFLVIIFYSPELVLVKLLTGTLRTDSEVHLAEAGAMYQRQTC